MKGWARDRRVMVMAIVCWCRGVVRGRVRGRTEVVVKTVSELRMRIKVRYGRR